MGADPQDWWRRSLKRDKGSFWTRSLDDLITSGPTPAQRERRERFRDAGEVQDAFARITRMHREPVPAAKKPNAAPPALANRSALRRSRRREACKGIPIWRRPERRGARLEADRRADQEADALDAKARAEATEREARIEAFWEALHRHEPEAVVEGLALGFRGFPYRPIAYAEIDGGSAVFFLYTEKGLPFEEPDLTPTGRLTVRRLSKTKRNSLSREALAAITINAARRALTATPGAKHATAVAIRQSYYGPPYEAIAWIRVVRGQEGWTADPYADVAFIRGQGVMGRKGRTHDIARADFSSWPELQAIAETIQGGQRAVKFVCRDGKHPAGAFIKLV